MIAKPYWIDQRLDEHVLQKRETWKRETRKLACLRADLAFTTRVCTTHIGPTPDGIQEVSQIHAVARVVDPWVAGGEPVVLMGDFNERPWSIALDPIYAPSYERGEGEFVEVDGFDEGRQCRCGSRTLKRKIDYIFLSENHWGEIWGKVTHTTTESDHRMLHGGGVLMGDG